MLKRKMFRKIIVATTALFALFLIYLIPKEESKATLDGVDQNLEYTSPDILTSPIFLMDSNNYLGKTEVVVSSTEIETKIKELVEVLISGGVGENKIPSGFKSILPSETKILSIKYEDKLVKIDFSKDLLDITEELEEKMIEAIVYTVTSIEEVEKVIIYVEGDILTKLPKTGKNLPSTLDRNLGINKNYDLTSTKEINQVTVYYLNKYGENYYYVPVTKYLNDNRDKITIIVDELTSSSTYNTNLMSFLSNKTKLLAINEQSDILELTFNAYIFSDLDQKKILEEVIHTISLSIKDNYNVSEVNFIVDDEEIHKSVLKTLE